MHPVLSRWEIPDALFAHPMFTMKFTMKFTIEAFILFATLCCHNPIAAQTSTSDIERVDSLILGNCNIPIVVYENIYNNSLSGGAALYYPKSTMQMYKDCQIKELYIGIANYKSIESLQIFITHRLEEPYDYIQSSTITKNNWNRITLDQPFIPDGKPIYIGYMIKGASTLCYTEAKEDNEEWINQRDNTWEKYVNRYSAALYAIVEGGSKLPKHNIRLKKVKMPYYSLTNTPISFEGKISNLGTETIHSLEYIYQVGTEQYKEELQGLNIKSHTEAPFHISGLKLAEEGNPDLTLSVVNINGYPDQDMTDNSSRTVTLLCRNEFTERKVLLEVFSTERCSSCPSAHYYLSKEREGDQRVIELGHHSGFYDDKFTIPTSVEYEWFYRPDRHHAPAMMLDRNNMWENYPEYYDVETPVIEIKEKVFPTIYANALKAPAFASVHLNVEKNNTYERTINIHVYGTELLPLPPKGNERLFLFLTEDSVFSTSQVGSNKSFYHRHIARKGITGTWGDPISIAEGFSADYSVDIPETWNTDNMNVIAFIGNYDPENRNNCHVYNAETFSLRSLFPTDLHQQITEELQIIREGSFVCIPTGYDKIKLYSMDGQCLLSDSGNKQRISLEKFPKGSYVLYISSRNRQKTFKLNL